MKRSELVAKLVKEGMSEKTLVNFTDKQLEILSNRMVSEQQTKPLVIKGSEIAKMDPNTLNSIKSKSAVTVVNEKDEIENESPKKKKTKEVKEDTPTFGKKVTKGHNGTPEFMDSKELKEEKCCDSCNKVESKCTCKKDVKEWVEKLVENNYHSFTSKNEIMELIQVKLNENKPAPSKPERETPVREKPTTRPEKPKRENPFEPKHTPKPKALGEDDENKPKMPEFMKFKNLGIKFKDQK